MLRIMRDENAAAEMRFEAAKAAAPYVHAKLAAMDATLQANTDGTITFTWLPPDSDDSGFELPAPDRLPAAS
jgi:hypothetical protein